MLRCICSFLAAISTEASRRLKYSALGSVKPGPPEELWPCELFWRCRRLLSISSIPTYNRAMIEQDRECPELISTIEGGPSLLAEPAADALPKWFPFESFHNHILWEHSRESGRLHLSGWSANWTCGPDGSQTGNPSRLMVHRGIRFPSA